MNTIFNGTLVITILIANMSFLSATKNVKHYINTFSSNFELNDASIKHWGLNENTKMKIVIDAGHGGHDSGCLGKLAKEKDLSLQMALKLGREIEEKYSNVEVLYTRTTDVFIPLFRRIQYANEENADLFISIHCNYISNPKTRGTETFVMGLHRAEDNLDVVKRENSSILLEKNYVENYDGYDPNSTEGHIMMSMYQNAYLDQSISFAADVESSLQSVNYTKSRGVKQAGFAVLRRASMPAVLIEAGFLSNSDEESFLISDNGQQSIINAIVKSFGTFYQSKKVIEVVAVKQVEQTSNSGPFFRIQIAVLKNETRDMDTPELRKIGKLIVLNQDNVNKYQVGDFKTRNAAIKAKEQLVKIGYSGAFLVALRD